MREKRTQGTEKRSTGPGSMEVEFGKVFWKMKKNVIKYNEMVKGILIKGGKWNH